MPGDEPASRWPSDDEPCDTCDGLPGNAPCLACNDTGIVADMPMPDGTYYTRICPECDPPLPCPDCDEQLISERNHEKRCAYARLEQG